jgi:hypothetical protein
MELKELLSNLAQNLNKGSSQYDKKYVGYICNFLSIAKIEAFSNSILLLK